MVYQAYVDRSFDDCFFYLYFHIFYTMSFQQFSRLRGRVVSVLC